MTDGDTPRLIYLLLLLLLVGGGFWSSRHLLTNTHAKMAVAWLAIFGGVAFVYSLKDSLIGGFAPAQAELAEDGRTITLSRSRSGSFEAMVEVNGAPIRFLVDTGATDVVLSRQDAARAGIDVDRLNFDGVATTANGTVPTAEVTLDQINLAGLIDRNVRASVNGGELFFSLLGMTYLNRFERIEISGDEMLLVR